MKPVKILAICGSLGNNSSNMKMLETVSRTWMNDVEFILSDSIRHLPHFNPELDNDSVAQSVTDFRQQLKEADAVLICTPEYAYGVPGSLKNALDWTVSSGELVNKPLALITASLSGEKAQAALLQTFTALSANITAERTLLLSFIRSKLDEQGHFKNKEDEDAVQKVIESLKKSVIS
jgi:chromate reductase